MRRGSSETKSRPWAAGPALFLSDTGAMMSTATAQIIESGDLPYDERDRVSLWRCEELRRAGYSLIDALHIAVQHDIDLHLAIALPARGCPHETALRILV